MRRRGERSRPRPPRHPAAGDEDGPEKAKTRGPAGTTEAAAAAGAAAPRLARAPPRTPPAPVPDGPRRPRAALPWRAGPLRPVYAAHRHARGRRAVRDHCGFRRRRASARISALRRARLAFVVDPVRQRRMAGAYAQRADGRAHLRVRRLDRAAAHRQPPGRLAGWRGARGLGGISGRRRSSPTCTPPTRRRCSWLWPWCRRPRRSVARGSGSARRRSTGSASPTTTRYWSWRARSFSPGSWPRRKTSGAGSIT